MKFMKCCGDICVVLDMVVLRPMFVLELRTFPVDTNEDSELLWAYLCTIGYASVNTNI